MEETLLLAKKKGTAKSAQKMRIYFLERGRYNNTGAFSSFVGVYYVEIYDDKGQPISLGNFATNASSVYSTGYPIYAPTLTNNQYWCSTSANDGNPNKSCWWEVDFGTVRKISRVRIFFADPYLSNNVQIENEAGVILGAKSKSVVPYWPLAQAPMGNIACADVVF